VRLAATDVSVVIDSLNDIPIVVERAMWWPGPTLATWSEAHSSGGQTLAVPQWLAAGGESGGTRGAATYVLIANTGSTGVDVDVTVLFEDRAAVTRRVTLAPDSRYGFDVVEIFPEAAHRRYGVLVDGRDAGAAIVVERATYWSAPGGFWAAGVSASAMPVHPSLTLHADTSAQGR
jgi:hypothetical protein